MQPNQLKWQEFQLLNKHRQIAQLDTMIDEFEKMIAELEEQIIIKEHKKDTNFATSTVAQAARQRRDNLVASVNNLRVQRDTAASELSDMKMYQNLMTGRHKHVHQMKYM